MEKIVKIGIKKFHDSKEKIIKFTDDESADNLINDIENNPHVYVLGCLMDRQIKAKKAWMVPQRVFDALHTSDINKLSKVTEKEYINIFSKENLHRFNTNMAEIFYNGIQDIKTKYHENASEIWNGNPSSSAVVYRFLEFKGCGIKIATMAANILARQFKIKFSDYYSIDISPDVHIMRVMKRMGYVPEDAAREMVIYKARELHPEFPGVIDPICWEIGTKWCKPKNPKCDDCIVKSECRYAKG